MGLVISTRKYLLLHYFIPRYHNNRKFLIKIYKMGIKNLQYDCAFCHSQLYVFWYIGGQLTPPHSHRLTSARVEVPPLLKSNQRFRIHFICQCHSDSACPGLHFIWVLVWSDRYRYSLDQFIKQNFVGQEKRYQKIQIQPKTGIKCHLDPLIYLNTCLRYWLNTLLSR